LPWPFSFFFSSFPDSRLSDGEGETGETFAFSLLEGSALDDGASCVGSGFKPSGLRLGCGRVDELGDGDTDSPGLVIAGVAEAAGDAVACAEGDSIGTRLGG
ncbi:MAG: hypothetical protein JWO45_1035, partial [Spartobacteria bacterium]|nr:hypothetical protein [Spartobacteria bacterium]